MSLFGSLNMTVELVIVAWAVWAVFQSQRRPRTVSRRSVSAPRPTPQRRTPRVPLIFSLGRMYGRVVAAWRAGVASTQGAPPVAARLPPLLVQDVAEAVDLALFERERSRVAAMPYVEKTDPLLESLVMTELGTPPEQGEQLTVIMVKAALDAGYSGNQIAAKLRVNRQQVYATIRDAKAA